MFFRDLRFVREDQNFYLLSGSFTVYFFAFVGGLAATRIGYELLFPDWLWLGRPLPAFGLAIVVAFAAWIIWLRGRRFPPLALLPLLLNLTYLANPAVDLAASRLIFGGTLWLAALLLAHRYAPARAWRWLGPLFVAAALLPVYLLTMSHTVGRDDTFEFQVVTPQLGIVHPTGYPLYLLLGKLFTLLPFGSMAWRLNFASTVYALAALALIFLLLWRLWARPLTAVPGSVAIGLTPTFWSQAIVAEVYALHALVVAGVLWLLVAGGGWRVAGGEYKVSGAAEHGIRNTEYGVRNRWVWAAFLIGLGLTNHLTTVFLIPPLLLAFLLDLRHKKPTSFTIHHLKRALPIAAAAILPLALYAYLPLRWQVVVGEPMGFGRFVDWVIGGRFQDALQWRAWLVDPTRYKIVGRLFLDNWGWFNLALAAVGLAFLFVRRRRAALILLLTWLGYTFYCLNYYVPDLAVFLLPAQLVVGVWWASGVAGVMVIGYWVVDNWAVGGKIGTQGFAENTQRTTERKKGGNPRKFASSAIAAGLFTVLLLPLLLPAARTWRAVDQSADDGRSRWARAVLDLPLAENAAILADSDKFPPLFYVQQTEDVRPDLDISVWPDEAAYRAQLTQRLAAGQTIYLARFLPGLEGSYHLRSAGPLVEVGTEPLTWLPGTAVADGWQLGPIRLVGYEVALEAPVDPTKTAVTFYWQATEPVDEVLHVYTRFTGHAAGAGQHPANNFYPTVAWRPGEIVPDYHELPRPIITGPAEYMLEVGLAPPFTPPQEIDWQPVTLFIQEVGTAQRDLPRPLRLVVGETAVSSADFPTQIRPQQPLPLLIAGHGAPENLHFQLENSQQSTANSPRSTANHSPFTIRHSPFTMAAEIETDVANGRYALTLTHPDGAVCGWLRPATRGCALGEVAVSGAPLPPGAINFDDKIALLDVDAPQMTLTPGGVLEVTLRWQALAQMDENYTVFVQVLDAQDRLVGQVDSWPVQGTRPTSQWRPGETITDPYRVQLDADLPPGQYRLQVGWYLLATLRRLPVLDESGTAVDDRVVRPGLVVP